jgi:hypothetical protein
VSTQAFDVLYFTRANSIGASHRLVQVGSDDPRHAALEALLGGPDPSEAADGLGSAVPPGTDLRGLAVSNGVAAANFGPNFSAPAAQATELARLAQVVYTLTEFAGVNSVSFSVAGTPLTSFGGISLASPVGRSALTAALPPVFLQSPVSGNTIGSSLEMKGTTTYSGTFHLQLIAQSGVVLLDTEHTAVPNGNFADTFPLPSGQSGTATVRISALSPAGSPLDEIQVMLPIQT